MQVKNLFHMWTEVIDTIINVSSPRNILHMFVLFSLVTKDMEGI